MSLLREVYDTFVGRSKPPLVTPPVFRGFALLATLGVLAVIALSILFPPEGAPMYHFRESGAITATSAICLAMTSILAAATFYLRSKDWHMSGLFWLILAVGCLFLSFDEQLMFHERGGAVIETTSIGASEFFRNWNDLIVILYGVVALTIAAVFGREAIRCRAFALLFALGFVFYAIHTGIDSLMSSTVRWKDIPEESAKLLSVFSVFLAACAQLLATIEHALGVRHGSDA